MAIPVNPVTSNTTWTRVWRTVLQAAAGFVVAVPILVELNTKLGLAGSAKDASVVAALVAAASVVQNVLEKINVVGSAPPAVPPAA